MKFPVVIQHRHVHLSEKDAKKLFGKDCKFEIRKKIGHRGQGIFTQTVNIIGDNGIFEDVCVIGPWRSKTQVELSSSDAVAVGIDAPVRISGDLARSGSCVIKGPLGEINARASVIIAARHLHCDKKVANKLGVLQGDVVSLGCGTNKETKFNHVTVRVHPTFANELHISADEAAENWIQSGDDSYLCTED